MRGLLNRTLQHGEHKGTSCCIRDPEPQLALTCNAPVIRLRTSSEGEMTLDYDAFLGCMGRWNIMSHFIKSGCGGGKREKEVETEGENAFISFGYQMSCNGDRLFKP